MPMDPRIKELIRLMRDLGIIRITDETRSKRKFSEDPDIEIWWEYSDGHRINRIYPREEVD